MTRSLTKATWKSDVEQYEALRDCLIALTYSLKIMTYPGISAAIRQHNDLLVMSNIWFTGKPADQWRFYSMNQDGVRNLTWLVNQFTGIAAYFGLTGVIHSYHACNAEPRMSSILARYNHAIRDRAQWQRSRQLESRHQEFNLPRTAFYVLREKSTNGQVQITGEGS
ncbi:hypothetical protein pEaSNUABM5_00238 [Erwinia phage pEa_SNUABM_5]|uniref:Uncharacterized protein n=1 Tax=Erwinia phage pEa_SNUABM_5 TaxID=2797313 RepID=A0A7T8EPM8_9CAUD|nr:hypothetical protein MPK73_gp238 [Erwinia phage pEa_SNUABM_5]QQO90380.1 hypothetical protein pEaSNUABM5_00238 [Erwinia phage pEa_SNUABM_5]